MDLCGPGLQLANGSERLREAMGVLGNPQEVRGARPRGQVDAVVPAALVGADTQHGECPPWTGESLPD